MKRLAEMDLSRWYRKSRRKPLVIRGARQVGKSTLVRNFAVQNALALHEINLERHRELETVFNGGNTTEVLKELAFACGTGPIRAENSLLFLDEIQATPSAIPFLRYLYEDVPELAVVCAGSLLEFALARHDFSMPVGRIEYLFLGPMTFSEFLFAQGEEDLVNFISTYDWGAFSQVAHDRCLLRFRDYLLTGGMPEAVLAATESDDPNDVGDVHASIIETYINDFGKYARESQLTRLQTIFRYVPANTGRKVVYSQMDPHSQARDLRPAVDMLAQAQVITTAYHCHANGLPLRAEISWSVRKLYCLDVGIMNSMCGIRHITVDQMHHRRFINEGANAEQFAAQHLLFGARRNVSPELNYWLREGRANNAEVDFLITGEDSIVPVEVKAGKAGSLKSLHRFTYEKNVDKAVRLDLNPPSHQQVNCRFRLGATSEETRYQLVSLPIYMVEYLLQLAASAPCG